MNTARKLLERVDWGLYLVIGRHDAGDRDILELVEQAVAGGVTVVQWREKQCSFREGTTIVQRLLGFLRPRRIPLLVNDRVDIALASGADGVHLGQSDMPYPDARRLLGEEALIGLSVENPEQTRRANGVRPDYLGASPVFDTPSKTDTAPALGIDGLRELRELTELPVVAIGGIHPSNAAEVMGTGVDGIAVISAICAAPDPRAAASVLSDIVSRCRELKE